MHQDDVMSHSSNDIGQENSSRGQARGQASAQRQHIPSSMVAELGSLADQSKKLSVTINDEFTAMSTRAADQIDVKKVIQDLYTNLTEILLMERKKNDAIIKLTQRNNASERVLSADAAMDILQHASPTSERKAYVPDVSNHKAIQALLVFSNDRQ